ncbi:CaiB/BaiF CoA transferase family protein [Streptomyces sp. NPDC003247]|uniref:CaiB/BaiF CoA transferase family protein n=1 Tax=Streptomyces sp. NPDC003247 TaxID=3364677 RepID=UPI0036A57917
MTTAPTAPTAASPPVRRPLDDVRVIAVEQYGAGPFGTWHLAELGAEIIKIEEPRSGGDVGRYVPPYQDGEDSLFFETFNRGKRSVGLDLATPSGRSVFEDLVRHSDAVYSNLRGDVPARIGITHADLRHLNPAVVCCSLTGFGMTGPRSRQPGYDYVLQGLAGWMDLTGEPGGPPAKSGLSLVDYSGGYVAAVALLAGLHAARRDGVGCDCDVSLYDTAVSMLTYPATWHLTADYEPVRTRHSAHPSLVPFQAFRARDGWLVVGCAKEKFWRRLAPLLGHPEWTGTGHPYADFAGRREHREKLVPELEELFAARTVAEWLAALTPAGVPCAPVHTVAEALADPHTAARGLVTESAHPRFGTVRAPASPVRVGPRPAGPAPRAPRRGEHTDAVLRDLLGYDDARIAALRATGAFGV